MSGALQIRRISPSQQPGYHESVERIQRRLRFGSRPVTPVVQFFAKKLRASIRSEFNEGGKSPFVWKSNARNTVAAKGHSTVLKGPHGWKLRDAISVDVVILSSPTSYKVDVRSPLVGEFMQQGWKGKTIRAKDGGWLWFTVAEKPEDFAERRKGALARRRAGKRAKVPSRPGKHLIRVKEVKHPGYPARKFGVIRDGFLAEAWRRPLRAYLFEGTVPR